MLRVWLIPRKQENSKLTMKNVMLRVLGQVLFFGKELSLTIVVVFVCD